ncbi:MAG: EamA family transporter [Pseudomonadota bacterium]
MKQKDIFLAVFVAFAWGSYFSVTKIIFSSMPPFLFASIRFFLLFLLTMPFFIKAKLPYSKVFFLSIAAVMNMSFLNYAINISSNISSIILVNQLSVPISAIIGIYYFKERFLLKDFLGIMIAFFGVAIVIHLRPTAEVSLLAIVFAFCSAVFFSGYNLIAKELSEYNLMSVLSALSLFMFPQFFCLSFVVEPWPTNIEVKSLIGLFYIVTVGSLLSSYTWLYLLKRNNMSEVMPFTALLSPVFGCLTTSVLLKEPLKLNIIIGGGLILTGLIILEIRKKDAKKI